MADTARDQQRLAEYEVELGDAENRLRATIGEVEALRGIVSGLRKRLESVGALPPAKREPAETEPTPRRRGPSVGLKGVLQTMLRERGELTADSAVVTVQAMAEFQDHPPSRNTIVSRLGDLVRSGEATSPRKGLYRDKNFAGRNGQPQQPLGRYERTSA